MCDKRHYYTSKAEADEAASKLTFKMGTRLRSYLCSECNLWRLTSGPVWPPKRQAEDVFPRSKS